KTKEEDKESGYYKANNKPNGEQPNYVNQFLDAKLELKRWRVRGLIATNVGKSYG
ncbi:15762_t:CDS:2, partial [Gigaspora rosea]